MLKQLTVFGTTLVFFGTCIGVLAIWQMRKSKLSILPEVTTGATLIDTGLYSLIRHPMYLAVIIASTGLAVNSTNYLSIILLFILVVDLFFKVNREEKLLEKEFKQYPSYKQKTKKIIPWVY